MHATTITTSLVTLILPKLDQQKWPSPDDLHPHLQWVLALVLTQPLTWFFDHPVLTGINSDDYRRAVETAIKKKWVKERLWKSAPDKSHFNRLIYHPGCTIKHHGIPDNGLQRFKVALSEDQGRQCTIHSFVNVQQGSILGPRLSLLFINYLLSIASRCYMFDDEIKLICPKMTLNFSSANTNANISSSVWVYLVSASLIVRLGLTRGRPSMRNTASTDCRYTECRVSYAD